MEEIAEVVEQEEKITATSDGAAGGKPLRPPLDTAGLKDEFREVDPRCPNASNPYHRCAVYCRSPGTARRSLAPSPRSPAALHSGNKNITNMAEKNKVDPSCRNASNPFHQCAEYCSNGISHYPVVGKPVHFANGHKEAASPSPSERNDVHPKCANASNPFHKCAEYCSI